MIVSMPSRAWVVAPAEGGYYYAGNSFNALTGLSCYQKHMPTICTCVRFNALTGLSCYRNAKTAYETTWTFQCPHGLELLRRDHGGQNTLHTLFQCPHGLELLHHADWIWHSAGYIVSMPSRAWVVTLEISHWQDVTACFNALTGLSCYVIGVGRPAASISFNALTGLSCYSKNVQYFKFFMILFMHTCYL